MIPLLTVPEAAAVLRVSRDFIYEHRTELGGVKVGRAVRIPEVGIISYLQRIPTRKRRPRPTRDGKLIRIVRGRFGRSA